MLYELNCFVLTIIYLLIWLGMGLGLDPLSAYWAYSPSEQLFTESYAGSVTNSKQIVVHLSTRDISFISLKCHLLSNG